MMDFLPTIAHLVGAELPEDRRIDGVNIWPVLGGELADGEPPPRNEFLYFRGFDLEAVRRGPWKLSLKYKALYNLDEDIGETTDVQSEHPDVVAALMQLARSVDQDLGGRGIGPGCRPLGRVEHARPLLDW